MPTLNQLSSTQPTASITTTLVTSGFAHKELVLTDQVISVSAHGSNFLRSIIRDETGELETLFRLQVDRQLSCHNIYTTSLFSPVFGLRMTCQDQLSGWVQKQQFDRCFINSYDATWINGTTRSGALIDLDICYTESYPFPSVRKIEVRLVGP